MREASRSWLIEPNDVEPRDEQRVLLENNTMPTEVF